MKSLQRLFRGFDVILVGSATSLTLIGIILIYSAQSHMTDAQAPAFWSLQLIWWGVAALGFVFAVSLPLRVHEVFAYVYLAVIAVVLLGLLGLRESGGDRWISLGVLNIQPSELAKLALMLALARYLAYLKRPVLGLRSLVTLMFIVFPIWVLVFKQPDLGTSLVFWVLVFVMVFWAGAKPLSLFLVVSPLLSFLSASDKVAWVLFLLVLLAVLYSVRMGLLSAVGVVALNMVSGIVTPFVWNRLLPYQKMRIDAFWDPSDYPRGAGYQIIQSKVAIGSGGLWGTGFLQGSQTGLHFIPEKHTDFIFAVAGEQFGFWGGALIIILFGVFLWRTIDAAYLARNSFARFLAIGAGTIVAFQMLVNIGMTVGLMPVTGLPLPFVSYGGSALVLFWFLTGLIVHVRRRWQEY